MKRKSSVVVLFLLLLPCCRPVWGQPARSQAVIKPVYFAAIEALNRGRYKQATDGFKQAGRNAIRFGDQRWVDSICYYTMLGEALYRQGQLDEARNYFESALSIYLQNADWMLRMKYPPVIAPKRTPRAPNWARSPRTFVLGNFPEVFSILRSGPKLVQGNGKTGVGNVQKLQSLQASELVRCTALAIRRYTELDGPLAQYNPLLEKVQSALAERQTAPNHWSQAWIDVPLGVAQAALGKKEIGAATLQRGILVNGNLDHPLTCMALLELGRIHLEESRYEQATNFFQAAALSAFYYNQPAVINEAFCLTFLAHIASGRGGIPANFVEAALWAKRNNLVEMYASLMIRTAEGYATAGNIKEADSTLNRVLPVLRRNKLSTARIGAEANFVGAVIAFARGDFRGGKKYLFDAMQFEKFGSVRLFHIFLVERAYRQGTIRDRVAMELFADVLRDPSAIVWRHSPLEAWSQLLVPQISALGLWFNAALKRDKPLLAMEIVDRMHRMRFLSTQPLGGRMLNLCWVLQGPDAAISQEALMQRQEFLTAAPHFGELSRQASQLRSEIADAGLLPANFERAKKQEDQRKKLTDIYAKQEKELLKMVMRREAVPPVFPPLRNAEEIRQGMKEGEAILMFYVAKQTHFGFLMTKEKQRIWKIKSPKDVQNRLKNLLKAMGNYDANSTVKLSDLAAADWQQTANQLRASLTDGAKIDLGKDITDLIVVPDHLYWYIPFEALQVNEQSPRNLLAETRVRYAPMLSLTVGDGRGRKQSGDWALFRGELFPGEASDVSQSVTERLGDSLPKTHTIDQSLKTNAHTFVGMLDGLLIWDDLDNMEQPPLGLAPLKIDGGRSGSTLQEWLGVPWASPEIVVLPGFHTPAENSLKKLKTKGIDRLGDELFLTSMGFLGSGTRTLLLSRWRMGGAITADLLTEFVQELPHTSAADAWQRAVQIVDQTTLDSQGEPRIKSDPEGPQLTGSHPFFWSSFLLIDPGDPAGEVQKEPPQDLKFPNAAENGE